MAVGFTPYVCEKSCETEVMEAAVKDSTYLNVNFEF